MAAMLRSHCAAAQCSASSSSRCSLARLPAPSRPSTSKVAHRPDVRRFAAAAFPSGSLSASSATFSPVTTEALSGADSGDSSNKIRVDEVMTLGQNIITCSPSDSIDTALELLVEHRITGLPVVDEARRVVGVVSDFDLLALETFGMTRTADLFPQAEQTWQTFMQVRRVLAKGTGKRVADVMTADPITVRRETNIYEATSLLLRKKIRRLPVVDEEGRLVGLLSRRDIVRSALEARKKMDAAAATMVIG